MNSTVRRLIVLSLLASAVGTSPRVAYAHSVGLSQGQYRGEHQSLHSQLVFARRELVHLIDEAPGEAIADGDITAETLAQAQPRLAAAAQKWVVVRGDGARCETSFSNAELIEEDGLAITLRTRCDAAPDVFSISLDFLEALPLGHRHVVRASAGGSALDLVAHDKQRTFELASSGASSGGGVGVAGMFLLGLEHILLGFDHLVFLFGLIIVGGSLRRLAVIITSFTIAHSITLGLAVLGVFAPSGSFIEPMIALSVAYVGIENLVLEDPKKRWILTFAFGLIHGFGFAGALGEISLPSAQIPAALFLFNLGVEVGQLSVLALVLPPILLLRRNPGFVRVWVRALSVVIALAGLYWFFDRVFLA